MMTLALEWVWCIRMGVGCEGSLEESKSNDKTLVLGISCIKEEKYSYSPRQEGNKLDFVQVRAQISEKRTGKTQIIEKRN